jgi:hypothetical protein
MHHTRNQPANPNPLKVKNISIYAGYVTRIALSKVSTLQADRLA